MRIIVTGGAGFIGSHVAEGLIERGHEVLVIDDLSAGKESNVCAGARFEKLDIRDRNHVDRIVDAFVPNAISHHAAQASVSVSVREPALDAEINVMGSIHLLQAAQRHGARVVFASTGGALYGEVPEGEKARESWPAKPLSPYACSKAAFEYYLRAKSDEVGLPYTILRYANVYGPRQDPHGEAGVVAIFLNRLLKGEPIQVNARKALGDDGCVRDYVYVTDVVAMNVHALEGHLDRKTANVGTGKPTSTRRLAETLVALCGASSEVRDGAHRPGDLERSVLDPSAISHFVPRLIDLEEGLARTTSWFREQHEK
ncbi:MAG: NAD-dependent epimerase/dehydratase family protein [Polyangiales bacterium]